MKIPKEFELFGQTIKVEIVDNLLEKRGNVGMSYFVRNHIDIQNIEHQETKEATFFWELTRFILHFMQRQELQEDEGFVSTFAHCLHQAMKTAKY